MKTKQIILALLLSAVPVFAQEGPNLVTNPGFEADAPGTVVPSGWDRASFGLITEVMSGGHSGNNHYRSRFEEGGSFVKTSQAVSVEPGTYVFRAWCRYSGGAEIAQIIVESAWYGLNQPIVVSPDEWLRVVTTTIVIPYPDTFRLGFEFKVKGAYAYLDVDDVEFVRVGPVPTPTPTPTPGTRSLTVKTKHLPGDQVPIKAPRKVNGLVFDSWVGDTGALENFTSPNTSVTIPSTLDVQVEATYKRP